MYDTSGRVVVSGGEGEKEFMEKKTSEREFRGILTKLVERNYFFFISSFFISGALASGAFLLVSAGAAAGAAGAGAAGAGVIIESAGFASSAFLPQAIVPKDIAENAASINTLRSLIVITS